MSDHIRTPSDDLQHIRFEGDDVCIIAPEDYDALAAELAEAKARPCNDPEHAEAMRHLAGIMDVEDELAEAKLRIDHLERTRAEVDAAHSRLSAELAEAKRDLESAKAMLSAHERVVARIEDQTAEKIKTLEAQVNDAMQGEVDATTFYKGKADALRAALERIGDETHDFKRSAYDVIAIIRGIAKDAVGRGTERTAGQPTDSLSEDLSEAGVLKKRIRLVADDIAFFGFDGALVLNCGDTFAYACADAEEVPDDQIDTVRRLHDKHGYPGLVAWIARRRGCEPLIQLRTEAYRAALADIDGATSQTPAGPTT